MPFEVRGNYIQTKTEDNGFGTITMTGDGFDSAYWSPYIVPQSNKSTQFRFDIK